jgi:hypothetical protein
MKKDFKTSFNEVARLADVMDTLGSNVSPHLWQNIYDELHRAADQDKSFDASDYDRYAQMKAKNNAAEDYAHATDVYLKVLRQGDKNLNLVMQFTNIEDLRTYLPKIENPAEIKQLAEKYGISSFQKLVP